MNEKGKGIQTNYYVSNGMRTVQVFSVWRLHHTKKWKQNRKAFKTHCTKNTFNLIECKFSLFDQNAFNLWFFMRFYSTFFLDCYRFHHCLLVRLAVDCVVAGCTQQFFIFNEKILCWRCLENNYIQYFFPFTSICHMTWQWKSF